MLYTAIRHQQVPLDFVLEQDALDGTLSRYKVLYLADAHVSTAASAKIAEWVHAGGQLLATAGAGMFDELNRPNIVLRQLFGVDQTGLDAPPDAQITYEKQDLPFARPIDGVNDQQADDKEEMPVFALRSRVKLAGATAHWTFRDGSPAVTVCQAGKGRVIYCAFLPSLSYYKPAIPLRPVDRGATDDAMIHFLPTQMDQRAAALIGLPCADLPRPVECSVPLVETTVIESPHGLLIPLVNWTPQPVKDLRVKLRLPATTSQPALASGTPLQVTSDEGCTVLTFDLDVADALILRQAP
jgi:hypothetical protein